MNAARFALLACVGFVGVAPLHAAVVEPFISEVHYDNAGADVAEFVAVTGPQGLDLNGWEIALYNGSNGSVYGVLPLSGLLQEAASGGLIEAYWPATGLQNGPDAIALISDSGAVADFIAYEQVVTANDGAAAGATARLLPLSEGSSTVVGDSLQRIGALDDWIWMAGAASPGVVNPGLQLPNVVAVPLPTVLGLWLIAVAGWIGMRTGGRRSE